jgi:hypothetical protein
MNSHSEHLERMISRRLDGAMSPDEALEFDKLLLRDPQVRALFEDSRRIDELAKGWLSDVCAAGLLSPKPGVTRGRLRTWVGRRWMLGSVAACLVLWGLWPTLFPHQPRPADYPDVPLAHRAKPVPGSVLVDGPSHSFTRGHTTLDYLGVLDEASDRLYLLEIRQTERAGAGWLHNGGRPIRAPGFSPPAMPSPAKREPGQM